MKILLTGAAGFTGRYFKVQAEASGHEIYPLLSNLEDRASLKNEVAEIKPDAVVHLAAISFVGHVDPLAFYAVNVVGSVNLLDALAALETPLQSVILVSSANVYGNSPVSPITEEAPFAPLNHYAVSKVAMEYMAANYMDRLPITITRPFNYTGPGQADHFLIPKLVSHFARKAEYIELGNLNVEREFNDVRMLCEVYLSLLEKAQSGHVYNICSGRPYSLKEVIARLEKISGHSMDIRVNPAFVRTNELLSLCGNPDKLIADSGVLPHYDLEETLSWMLKEGSV